MSQRPSWDDTAMKVIRDYEERSHCKYFQVAAVFFRGNRQLVVGYNGPPSGEPHCDEIGCAKAIINAGVVKVVYLEDYDGDEYSFDLLSEANIKIRRHKE